MTRLQRRQKKENPKVLELFGYAVGVIGLSVDEFRDLTGEEFAAIATSYEKRQEDAQRGEWERTGTGGTHHGGAASQGTGVS